MKGQYYHFQGMCQENLQVTLVFEGIHFAETVSCLYNSSLEACTSFGGIPTLWNHSDSFLRHWTNWT